MPSSAQNLSRQILALVLLFLLVGEIALFSATGVLGLKQHGNEFYYVFRQGSCAGIGLVLILILSQIRYQIWKKLAFPIVALQLGLVGCTLLFGHNAQGATRWLRFSGFTFQSSELAKLSLAIFLARFLDRRDKQRATKKEWAVHLIVLGALLLLIYRQPDLGTTVLLASTALGLFFIAGIRPAILIGVLGSGAALVVYSMLHSEYRKRRLLAYLNPWLDPQGNGFQAIQSFLSFYSGKIFGVGLGNGNSKLFFLPEVHTDFIFSLIGEETGFVGAVALIALFAYFGYLLFKVAARAPDAFGTFLAFGLAFSLLLQVIVNVGGVTGLFPVKGLPLPFISWGRSALIVNLVAVGILLNIARQSAIVSGNKPQATQ